MSMRVLPVGDDALLVEVASGEEAAALHAELLRRRAAGLLHVREIVPAARTVLLDGVDDPERLRSDLSAAEVPPAPPHAREVIELPVRYDGPDLADVAAHWGVSGQEVARIHAATEVRVARRTVVVIGIRAGPPRAPPCRRVRWRWRGRTRACTRARRRAAGS